MPVYVDPAIAAATVRLKDEQAQLTALRRRHLENEYIELSKVREHLSKLSVSITTELSNFPSALKRQFPALIDSTLEKEIRNFHRQFIADAIDGIIEKTKPEASKPIRKGPYTSKPGPKGPWKNKATSA